MIDEPVESTAGEPIEAYESIFMPKKPAELPTATSQFTDDNFYHQFFSNAEVVADLLKMVQPELLAELDLNSFTQVSNEFISADMRARRGDVFWKVQWKAKDKTAEDGWLYIYILASFEESVGQRRFRQVAHGMK